MKKILLLFTLGVILCMVSCEKANEPSITEKTVTDGCRVCIRYISGDGDDYIEYVGVDGRNHKDYYAGVYLVKKETTIIIYNGYDIYRINVGNAEKLYIEGDDGDVYAYPDMSF